MERKDGLENLKNQLFTGPIVMGPLHSGMNKADIIEDARIFLDMQKRSYSLKDTAIGMIKKLEEMASSRPRTTSNDQTIEILSWAREMLESKSW